MERVKSTGRLLLREALMACNDPQKGEEAGTVDSLGKKVDKVATEAVVRLGEKRPFRECAPFGKPRSFSAPPSKSE